MYDKFLRQMTEFVFVKNKPEKADIIFIPGSGFPQIAEKAAQLYKEGYAPIILPSGKYSITAGKFQGVQEKADYYQGDYKTEWEFLKEVLRKNGVPESAVWKEDSATYTYQNAIYSRQVTDKANLNVKKGIICCKPPHARRSLLYYQLLYPDTEFLVVPAEECGITKDNWYLSEKGCRIVLGEITRCGEQFHEILKELREKS